ncbi:very short patch repair endonuclease [Rhodovulum imhoffii]|nr:very short patch repair endonuclease [Rhodovulum imhoffii]
MSKVRNRDTKPELAVRRFLHSRGLRYRLHRSDLPGRPDIVFPTQRIALFVHGCFWHQHSGCAKAKLPSTRQEFWQEKLSRNAQRDQEVQGRLSEMGWRSMVVWECELKPARLEALVTQIRAGCPD